MEKILINTLHAFLRFIKANRLLIFILTAVLSLILYGGYSMMQGENAEFSLIGLLEYSVYFIFVCVMLIGMMIGVAIESIGDLFSFDSAIVSVW